MASDSAGQADGLAVLPQFGEPGLLEGPGDNSAETGSTGSGSG
jgi:hypothetical protein